MGPTDWDHRAASPMRPRTPAASCACLMLLCLVWPSVAHKGLKDLLLANPSNWPDYKRGPGNYRWVLNQRALSNGVTFLGSHERLRLALHRMMQGENLTIATIGGSITAGQGCLDAPTWPQYLHNYMSDNYGPRVSLQNGAVPGTLSGYMSVCLNVHIPKTADIVFVEYSLNDLQTLQPPFFNNHRKQFERLLRKVLNFPNKPAVVLLHTFKWWSIGQAGRLAAHNGTFWMSAEREFDEFARYYHLPTLSLKTCCWELIRNNVDGFWHNVTRNQDPAGLRKKAFYYDPVHPDGNTGARVLAELSMHLLQRAIWGLRADPVTELDEAMVDRPLPEPMIPDNWESVSDKCFIGQLFTSVVTLNNGFDWVNEGQGQRSKWGMVSREPDSTLELTLDTRSSGSRGDESSQAADADADNPLEMAKVMVNLAYLRSYQGMGMAAVTCVRGCMCPHMLLDGHTTQKNSQLHIMALPVTQHEQCVIQIRVLKKSQTDGHKVKVAAVIVSEESGQDVLDGNSASVELVHDVTFKSKSSQFDMRNDDSGVLGRLLTERDQVAGCHDHPRQNPDEIEYEAAIQMFGY